MHERHRVLFILGRGKADQLGRRLARVADALSGPDDVLVEIAKSPEDIPDRIVAYSDRVGAVAIGGGARTLSVAASAMMQTRLPMAIVPLGTANDLARTLGVPLDPVRAAALVRAGRIEDIDVGAVGSRYFFNAAGGGLSVDVAQRLAGMSKGFGPLSYLLAMSDVVRARRSFRARVRVDGDEVALRSIQVTIGNGARHGGGMRVRRDADIDDGNLDLYSLEPLSFRRLMLLLPALLTGTHDAWRSVTTLRGKEIALETPDKPKRINADGEIVGLTPATFRLHRNAVLVYVPRTT